MTIARTLQKLIPYLTASADTLTYENESTTGTTVKSALDWILASLYPNTQDSVDIPADLPAVGNTLNDYRVVLDDGDGKAAGYRWEQREGEASPSWHKIHDMDWSSDAILTAFSDIAHELYVHKQGRTDTDDSGNPITGLYAGQKIYGGSASGQNLTLNANSGDGTGAESGYVQSDNTLRPTSDNALDLGTLALRFRDLLLAGDLTDGTDSVTVSNLKDAYDHSQVSSGNPHNTGYNDLSSQLGTVTVNGDGSGSVDLSTAGNKTLTLTVTDDSHNHTVSTITDFPEGVYDQVASILQDTDTITWTKDDGTNQISGDVTVDTGDISDIDAPIANRILASNAAGTEWKAVNIEVELTGDVAGYAVYDSTTEKWEIPTSLANTPLQFIDNNLTYTGAAGTPTTITANNHGLLTGETVTMYGDFTGEKTITRVDANTFTIPDASVGATSGYYIPTGGQLMWDTSTEQFQMAKEYEEISHSEISDLTTRDDHTQYVAKDGRASGQTIKGGVAASENLILESTNHATKGTVQTSDTFTPVTDASYSGGWSGTDLGSTTKRFNDLYMAGEAKGLRAENLGALPANSGTTVGRMVFVGGLPYWDDGSDWVSGGGSATYAVTSKVANYTATVDDRLIICSGTFTVSLPDAADPDTLGIPLTVKNIGTGTITIDPFSSQTLDGSTSYDIVDQWAAITMVCDGSNWVII
jgi:hypothetical protein